MYGNCSSPQGWVGFMRGDYVHVTKSAHVGVQQGTDSVPCCYSNEGEWASPSVSRILSRTTIHLGVSLPTRSCGYPGLDRRAVDVPVYLAPGGVYQAVPVTRDAGGLLHHRFTLACAYLVVRPGAPSAVCSLLHFPSGHPAWKLSSTLPCGVRTFLDEQLQPFAAAIRQARRVSLEPG